ncbi:MAG: glycoside hydrolase family 38 C-terminal domain-containing protein [Terriglobia bacterium]
MADSRRSFLRAMLAACASSLSYSSTLGQIIPSDNALQAQLSHLYTKEGNQLRQVILLNTPPATASGSVEVQIGGKTEAFDLGKALNLAGQYYLPITPVEQDGTARVVLKSGGKSLETFLQVRPIRKWTVYLIHNSHQDPGFLDLPSKMRQRFIPFIDDAMRFCEETNDWPEDAQFKWNIEVGYLINDYRQARGEEKVRQVMDWIKKGRMTVGGFYCSMNTDFMSLETLHRSVYYTTERLSREFGIHPEGAILDDVNGFTWGLPEVMAKAGLRYLVMGSNGDRDNMQNGNAPTLFYLAGPDGSEILIWRSIQYVEGFNLLTWVNPYRGNLVKGINMQEGEESIARYFDRHERSDYPFDAIAMQVAHDFTPPFKQLAEVARAWNAQWAYPRLRLSTIPEFFHYIESQNQDRIPHLRGGAPDGWVDLQLGEANSAALGRQTENYLPDVERLSTLASLVAGGPGRQDEFLKAYNELLMWEEHTIEWYDIRSDIYVDESQGGGKQHWEEKTAHARYAHETAQRIENECARDLCRNIRTTGPLTLVVWNPLSWQRTEIVRTPVPAQSSQPFRLIDAEGGKDVACQIEKRAGVPDTLIFLAEGVPSLGYKTYRIESGAPAAGGTVPALSDLILENEFYQISLSAKDGTIASLLDQQLKREFVDPRAEHGFNGLVYRLQERLTEREFKQLGEIPVRDVRIEKGASGPVYSSLKISGHVEYLCKFEHEIILYSQLKKVDIINRIMKKPVFTKETVHYAFPFALPTDYHVTIDGMTHHNTYKIDVPGGVMQPDLDQIPGSFRDSYVARHFVSISRGDYGVVWSSVDAPLVQLGGIQADKYLAYLTMEDDNWLARGWLYSFLMHNHWVVDVPIAQGGDYVFRYSLATHGSDWSYNDAHHFGWSALSPLRAYTVEAAQEGKWQEAARSFLEAEPANVYVAGFKTAEDGKGVILRLYEGAGLATYAVINFKLPGVNLKTAALCDGRERILSPLTAENNSLRIALKPWETSTVRVQADFS